MNTELKEEITPRDIWHLRELLALCCSTFEVWDMDGEADVNTYKLVDPVDTERVDRLLENSLFVDPYSREQHDGFWLLAMSDRHDLRPKSGLVAVMTYPGHYHFLYAHPHGE